MLRANLRTLSSYPVRFCTDTLFSSLVYFAFCLVFVFVVVAVVVVVLNQKYIFWYTFDYAGVSDEKVFTRSIFGNKSIFWPILYYNSSKSSRLSFRLISSWKESEPVWSKTSRYEVQILGIYFNGLRRSFLKLNYFLTWNMY